MEQTKCLNCQTIFDKTIICDNDCATLICSRCSHEFYIKNNRIIEGHNPECGNDDFDLDINIISGF